MYVLYKFILLQKATHYEDIVHLLSRKARSYVTWKLFINSEESNKNLMLYKILHRGKNSEIWYTRYVFTL